MSEQHSIFNIDQWLYIRRLNSTVPFPLYIVCVITITINTQAHLVLVKYFIVPRKSIFFGQQLFYIRTVNQH